jgi:3-oxoacyl-[acyl-carrier protein] reductase
MNETRRQLEQAGRVCLFGLGHLLQDCYPQIVTALGGEPDVLCDNAPQKWGRSYFGRPCLSPLELQALAPDVFVLITVKRYEGILEQLASLGLHKVAVAVFDRSYHTLASILPSEIARRPGAQAPPLSMAGKWTLVTGASRGIGRILALEMARLGSNLILHGRAEGHLAAVVSEASRQGVEVLPLAADLQDPAQLERMVSELVDRTPPVDILFNNAALSTPTRAGIWSATSGDYLSSYAVNSVAPILLCQALAPGMVRRGFGRMVHVTSSIQHRPNEMPYACSKAALDKYVHDMAPSLAGTGVAMSLVDPGWIRTDMGGTSAPCAPESVLPGAILGAVAALDCNGWWFGAQDYAGLSLPEAIQKAAVLHARPDASRP